MHFMEVLVLVLVLLLLLQLPLLQQSDVVLVVGGRREDCILLSQHCLYPQHEDGLSFKLLGGWL